MFAKPSELILVNCELLSYNLVKELNNSIPSNVPEQYFSNYQFIENLF